ncbi:MAG: SapC family protein, partial [Novosphingobium sp.]
MASAPQANLPLFYQDLMPLNSRDHSKWKSRQTDKATWLAGQHAVPLTAEEFPDAARNYPIIFSSGENSVPLALMGLN